MDRFKKEDGSLNIQEDENGALNCGGYYFFKSVRVLDEGLIWPDDLRQAGARNTFKKGAQKEPTDFYQQALEMRKQEVENLPSFGKDLPVYPTRSRHVTPIRRIPT